MKYLRLLIFSVIFLIPFLDFGQKAFSRIEAEITIKEIDSTSRITTGKMFYDKNLGSIYYSIKFPTREVVVYTDSMIYRLNNDKVVENHKSATGLKFNIFNLGFGKGFSILEIINIIENQLDVKIDYEFKNRRKGDPPKLIADITKARDILKWIPSKNINDIINDTFLFYRRNIKWI